MMILLPYFLAAGVCLVDILLCLFKLNRRSFIILNAILWAVIALSFFVSGNGDSDSVATSTLFAGFISFGKFSFSFGVVVAVLMVIFLCSHLFSEELFKNEFVALASLANFGLMAMSVSSELILTLIFLEIASISVYAMIAISGTQKGVEAAFKYFVLSAFMGAFYLLGAAFIYGLVGSTKYELIAINLNAASPIAWLAIILVISMMFFKIAIFGFYRWSVDVYFGSAASVTGYLASAFKVASFAILINFIFIFGGEWLGAFKEIFAILAVLSMFAGNLLSVKENSVKRLLIVASVVHGGYIFIGLSSEQLYAAVFYLCAYGIVAGFCFGILNSIFGELDAKISDLAGLYKTHPLQSFAILIICLSFIGFPLTVGFVGKLFLFSSAVQSDQSYLLAFGIINTIISVYYYLRIISAIYFAPPNFACVSSPVMADMRISSNITRRSSTMDGVIFALLAAIFVVIAGSGVALP